MHEIRWAERIEKDKIRKLYASDAAGLRDEALLEEVGWALCARADSFIAVNRAHEEGVAVCPVCGEDVRREEGWFSCACGWRLEWEAYHATYHRKQLTGGSVVPFAREFLNRWNRALGDADAKMRAIDILLHRFHWELEGRPSRPAAINFIKGGIPDTFLLLHELAHADTPEWCAEKARWKENFKKANEIWKMDL